MTERSDNEVFTGLVDFSDSLTSSLHACLVRNHGKRVFASSHVFKLSKF